MKTWLKCRINRGMYKNERVVTFRNTEGKRVQGTFPKKGIGQNRLKVEVRCKIGNEVLVCWPSGNCGGIGFWGNASAGVWVFKNQLLSR